MQPTSKRTTVLIGALTAEDLMSPNLISLRENAALDEALHFFIDHGYNASVVIDEAGHPRGVISRSDLLHHIDKYRRDTDQETPPRVAEIMTPTVHSTRADASLFAVVEQLVTLDIHQLYVVDSTGLLIGVITPMDILRQVEQK